MALNTLMDFLSKREGLDNIEAIAFEPPPGFISPDDEQIIWSGREWELIKDFCPITGEFSDFLLWNRRECCGIQIQVEDDWDNDEIGGNIQDSLIEDTQTQLVSAIAAFEQAQTLSTDVHQLCLFEEVAI